MACMSKWLAVAGNDVLLMYTVFAVSRHKRKTFFWLVSYQSGAGSVFLVNTANKLLVCCLQVFLVMCKAIKQRYVWTSLRV